MAGKFMITGFVMVCIVVIGISIVEMFVPVSINSSLKTDCRNALIRMEANGGMTQDIENTLEKQLQEKKLTDVVISGTYNAKYGEEINLEVSASYTWEPVFLFFKGSDVLSIEYNRTSISRMVIN